MCPTLCDGLILYKLIYLTIKIKGVWRKSCKLASEKKTNCNLNSAPVMTANLENIHEIYNIFCQKNRMNADIINLFDHFHLSQRLRHLKMEKQQGVSASLLIVLLCLFRMCHESIGSFYSHQFYGLFQSGKNCFYRMYNRSSMDWSYPDPEAEWHFDIRKMSAISHILEEKQGSNAAQNSMIAQFFIERFVQFCSARFKGSLHVRPGTLWTYVLNPSRRTCKHPLNVRPQSQGRTSIGFFAGEIDIL